MKKILYIIAILLLPLQALATISPAFTYYNSADNSVKTFDSSWLQSQYFQANSTTATSTTPNLDISQSLKTGSVVRVEKGTAYVYRAASDTDAARGTALLSAISDFQSGDTINFCGSFDVGTSSASIINSPVGMKLIGCGDGPAYLYGTPANYDNIIDINANGYYANFKVSCSSVDFCGSIGYGQDATARSLDGAVIQNVTGTTDSSDSLFMITDNINADSYVRVIDSNFQSAYDAMAIWKSNASTNLLTIDFINGSLLSDNTGFSAFQGGLNIGDTKVKVRFFNTKIVVQNLNDLGDRTNSFMYGIYSVGSFGGTVEMYGGSATTIGSASSTSDFHPVLANVYLNGVSSTNPGTSAHLFGTSYGTTTSSTRLLINGGANDSFIKTLNNTTSNFEVTGTSTNITNLIATSATTTSLRATNATTTNLTYSGTLYTPFSSLRVPVVTTGGALTSDSVLTYSTSLHKLFVSNLQINGDVIFNGTFGVDVDATFNAGISLNGLSALGATGSALCLDASLVMTVNTGVTTCLVSSRAFKHNINDTDTESALSRFLKLQPVSFNYNDGNKPDLGFIAEDVAKADARYAEYMNGKPRSLHLSAILSDTVSVVQSLWAKVSDHETRIQKLERENQELKARLDKLEKK